MPKLVPFTTRSSLYWAWALLALTVALLGANYYVFVPMKQDLLAKEERQLRRIVDATAASVENALKVVHIGLESIRSAYMQNPSGLELHNILRITVGSVPHLRAAAVADPAGRALHSSRAHPAPDIDLSKAESVRYFLDGGTEPLFISGPSRNVVDGTWQISLAIPLRDDAGNVTEIFSASLEPYYIYSDLLTVSDLDQDFITLLDRSSRIVASNPWMDATIGTPLGDSPFMNALLASDKVASGILQSAHSQDERVFAGQWLSNGRFVLAIARPTAVALGPWRTLSMTVVTASLFLLVLLSVTWRISARAEERQQSQSARLEAMNTRLQAETARAEQLAAVKAEFLANMSHEIRTPLNGIVGYAGLALEEADLPAVRDHIGRVLDAGSALRVIIDEILDFSRVEAGGLQLENAPFSI